jgi:hypothetical protein
MTREKAYKVYYTKGLIGSSKQVENHTKPVAEMDEKAGTAPLTSGETAHRGKTGAVILKIRTFYRWVRRFLRRQVFAGKKGNGKNQWRVIYQAYRNYKQ